MAHILHRTPSEPSRTEREQDNSINRASPTKGLLAESFAHLVREIRAAACGSCISPTSFQKVVRRVAPHLLDYQQQDCQEFLRFLLDGMSEDMCRRKLSAKPVASSMDNVDRQEIDLVGASTSSDQPVPEDADDIFYSGQANENDSHVVFPSPGLDRDQEDEKVVTKLVASVQAATLTSNQEIYNNNSIKDMLETALQDDLNNASSVEAKSAKNLSLSASLNSALWSGVTRAGGAGNLSTISRSPRPARLREMVQIASKEQELSPEDTTVVTSESKRSVSLPEATAMPEVSEPPSPEATAASSWESYLRFNDSIITDIFAGQLQSTIECTVCKARSLCFDPFLDISVPIPRRTESTKSLLSRVAGGFLAQSDHNNTSSSVAKCSLQDCLEKFADDEILDGDNMVTCPKCKVKRRCVKRLSIYRAPQVLIIHMKRFRYSNTLREKLSTDVTFPLRDLDLTPFLSADNLSMQTSEPLLYDLIGISHHSGNLGGGHYVAHVNTAPGISSTPGVQSEEQRWMCFNDEHVTHVSSSNLMGPSAYVLFYQLRQRTQNNLNSPRKDS